MRYYLIIITDPNGKELVRYSSLLPNGNFNPGSLNIEFDIPAYPLATPAGANYLRIWGLGLKDIFQSANYNNSTMTVYAGMSKGLPLADPKQQGIIMSGTINQAFGNWQDVNQTVDFVVYPDVGSATAPKNIVFDWSVNQSMGDAIKTTLTRAFPTYTVNVNINPKLVATSPDRGAFQTLTQFAQYVRDKSIGFLQNTTYLGVTMLIQQTQINVFDVPSSTTPTEISFYDLVGQPTWIGYQQINFKTVLRADLNVGDYIKVNTPIATVVQQSYSQYKNQTLFSNVYQISSIRHVGNFRGSDGDSWVTNIIATQLQA